MPKFWFFCASLLFIISKPVSAGEKEDSIRKMLLEKGFSPSVITVHHDTGLFALSKGVLSRILRNLFIAEDSLVYSYTVKFRDSKSNKVFKCTTYTSLDIDKKKESLPYDLANCKEIALSNFSNSHTSDQVIKPGVR